jgi:hypothetical protein
MWFLFEWKIAQILLFFQQKSQNGFVRLSHRRLKMSMGRWIVMKVPRDATD